ncbi:hypothetical protein ABZ362_26780 [Streptomyces sp. NPDC005951]|uniref:hypothetical protein n=1 Tax=Streptomyces sp. NPDC005951 TaxID=3154573 RepID=UPI0033C34B91
MAVVAYEELGELRVRVAHDRPHGLDPTNGIANHLLEAVGLPRQEFRNGASAEGLPPPPEQALSAPAPAAAATPAAILPKARRLRSWLLVDIVVLVSLRTCRVPAPAGNRADPIWSDW